MTTTNQSSNSPIMNLRDGALRAAVWENQKKDGTVSFNSITLTRTYKAADGTLKDTTSFSPSEMHRVMFLAHVIQHELLILKGEHPDPETAFQATSSIYQWKRLWQWKSS